MTFHGVTPELCKQAFDLILPAVKQTCESGTANRYAGTFVVLSPLARAAAATWAAEALKAGYLHELPVETIMFEAQIGTPEANAEADFQAWARGKALVSLLTGLPSARVQQHYPHLYLPGLILWDGSTVRDGLVVAFSGAEGWFDEMFSEWLASAIVGLCRHAVHKPGGALSQGPWVP